VTLTRLSAQLLKTGSDGALPITSSFAITASYAMNGGTGGGDSFPYTGSAIISGSLQVTGSVRVTQGITGSLLGTSSWAQNASTASLATSFSGSLQVVGLAEFGEGLIVSGGLDVDGGITGSLLGTSSWATVAISSSYTSGTLDISRYSLATSSLGNASGSMSINLNNGNYFSATSTDVTTWAIDNTPSSRAVGFVLSFVSGGAFTQIWPNSVIWPNGVAPTLTAAGQDTLTFITDNGGTAWRGVLSIKDSR
jgi:hypothetical protein